MKIVHGYSCIGLLSTRRGQEFWTLDTRLPNQYYNTVPHLRPAAAQLAVLTRRDAGVCLSKCVGYRYILLKLSQCAFRALFKIGQTS